MATAPQREPYRFTIAEYLAFEKLTADRHEYCDGTIYAMAGESAAHADITANVGGMLQQARRGPRPLRRTNAVASLATQTWW